MTFKENYSTKRVHDKKNHKYNMIVIDNNTGEKIGKTKWHGTNEKGISSNEIGKKEVVVKYFEKLTKGEMDELLQKYKNEGFEIPNYSKYSVNNLRFPFEYEVLMKVVDNKTGELKDKTVTICDDKPLTKKQLSERVEGVVKAGLIAKTYDFKVKSFKLKKLHLQKGGNYKNSYIEKVKKRNNKVKRGKNKIWEE
jgi:hypothetical protein